MPIAEYTILYNNKNITNDISQYVTSITYTDKTSKDADDIEINLEDKRQLWQNEWYPTKGAKISLQINYLGNVLNCGTFQIDEIVLSGAKDSGDIVTIKAISAGISKKIRTLKSFAHENKTLREIANTIAVANGLTLLGSIPNITIQRNTQYRETDLAYLYRLSKQYGLVFSIRDNQLLFYDVYELENRNAVRVIKKSDLTDYSINDKSFLTYSAARVRYHNPKTKSVVTKTVTANGDTLNMPKSDIKELHVKAENQQQAELKAKAALHAANSLQQGGTISLPGNTLYVAGNNIELQELGYLSGKYHITQSSHNISKDGGYACTLEIKRLALIAAEKHKSDVQKNAKKTESIDVWSDDENIK